MTDDTLRGAQFFQDLKIALPADGCELLGILMRCTATGFGTSMAQPAGHLALSNAAKKLNEAALAIGEKNWLAAELMLGAQVLQAVGRELEQKYYATIHGAIHPAN